MQCRFPTFRFPRQLGVLALLLAAGVTTGCSRTGKVTGKVTFDGKQVLVGHVTFTGPDGKTTDSAAIEDGVYTLTKVPVGLCEDYRGHQQFQAARGDAARAEDQTSTSRKCPRR